MAFLEVRLTLGKCQPTSVAFPASKNRNTKSLKGYDQTTQPWGGVERSWIFNKKNPILWKGNSFSMDKCSTVNGVLHRTAEPEANWDRTIILATYNRAFSLTCMASIYANSLEQKKCVCIRKEFNSHKIGLGHQHGRRFIVLGHQYGRRDVMWKHSIHMKMNMQWDREGWKMSLSTPVDSGIFTSSWGPGDWVWPPSEMLLDKCNQ